MSREFRDFRKLHDLMNQAASFEREDEVAQRPEDARPRISIELTGDSKGLNGGVLIANIDSNQELKGFDLCENGNCDRKFDLNAFISKQITVKTLEKKGKRIEAVKIQAGRNFDPRGGGLVQVAFVSKVSLFNTSYECFTLRLMRTNSGWKVFSGPDEVRSLQFQVWMGAVSGGIETVSFSSAAGALFHELATGRCDRV